MTKRRQNKNPSQVPAAEDRSRGGRFFKWLLVPAALAVAALALLAVLPSNSPPRRVGADKSREDRASAESPTDPAADSSSTAIDFGVLKGKWLREDGGYVLQIGNVTSAGKLEALYFNPRPIFVAKAEASQEGGQIKVFVELRDEGYPGCTYQLTYDAAERQLRGTYFQAAMGETYEVLFRRQD